MKNILKKLSFAALAVVAGTGLAHAAAPNADVCSLIQSLQGVFATLKILAAIGAVFCIAGWAWGYISKPADAKLEDYKTKGIGLLVGFSLLTGVTLVLQFLPGISGCVLSGW